MLGELAGRLGRDPTDEEIAAAADLPVEQVAEIKHATRVVTSLDRPVGDIEGATLGELIAAPGPMSARSSHHPRRRTVRRVVDEMPELEREVIRMRYGIEAGRSRRPTRRSAGGLV